MLKNPPPDRQLSAVVYRPKTADVTTLAAELRLLVPEARLTVDVKQGALVAWANPADHEKIRTTIEGLDGDKSPGTN